MVIRRDESLGGSPSTIPVSLTGSKEWSDSGLERNLFNTLQSPSCDASTNIDFELDEAVQQALGKSLSDDDASQSTESGVHDGELSVFSDAKTESSSKSAVQMRLETRLEMKQRARPRTAEEFNQKLNAANNRRMKSISYVVERAGKHYAEAKTIADKLDGKKSSNAESIWQKLDRKMTMAAERKEQHLQIIASRYQGKMEKASKSKNLHENDTKIIQQKLDNKLSLAAERKEQHMKEITSKLSEKTDKIKNYRDQFKADVNETKKKLEEKLTLAAQRKEQYIGDISTKLHGKAEKIENTKSQHEQNTKMMQEKLEKKMAFASRRKEEHLQSITTKSIDKIERFEKSKITREANTEALRNTLDKKLAFAAKRKEEQLQSIAGKTQDKMEKASENRDLQFKVIKEKVDKKLSIATERKEQHLNDISSKLHGKMEKISNTRSALDAQHDADIKAIKEKVEKRQILAAERKDDQIQVITVKNQNKFEKASQNRDEQTKAIQDKVEKKLSLASERKGQLVQEVSSKLRNKQEKISISKNQQEAEVDAMKQELNKKQMLAAKRKEQRIQSLVAKNQERHEKAAGNRELKTKIVQERVNKKLSQASERKEHQLKDITSKLHEKMEKVSSNRSIVDQQHKADTKAIDEKLSQKMKLATNNKEGRIRQVSEKMKTKMDKISDTKKSTQEKLTALGQKIAEKMAHANARNTISGNADRQQRLENFKKFKDDELEAKKQELERKLFLAAERKQDIVDAKASKAANYLSATIQRGMEALRKKEESSIIGEESFMCEDILPLTSINEDEGGDLNYVSSFEYSVAGSVASTASTKSKVQIRLESYKKSSISKSYLNTKLNSATTRRKLALLDVQEKAKIGSKYEKTSNKIQSTHLALKKLEEKFTRKMTLAMQRKSDTINKTVEKASESRIKFQEKNSQQDSKKVSNMQVKLEKKLLAALERKENIVQARAKKAAGKVSLSSERGQSALKQKELMMEKIKAQNQSKLNSAKSRRERLRELEKEKREISTMRRLMSQRIQCSDDVSVSSLQDKIEQRLKSANERKKRYLAAKASRAAEHVSSTSERGIEVMKERETKMRSETENKLESAAKRRSRLEEENAKKKEIIRKRREYALEFSRQKKKEQELIEKWESKSVVSQERKLPVVVENDEAANDDLPETIDWNKNSEEESDYDSIVPSKSEETYDSKKLAARNMLAQEILLANQAKKKELFRITEERREMERRQNSFQEIKKPEMMRPSDRPMSVGTMGSIDTTDLCSFDEEDMSISGLSTVREEESKIDRRKARAALALTELDIKLSEIQIMQAILLAEEASLNGESEFRTTEKSVDELNNVQISLDIIEDEKGVKKIKKTAHNFFNYTLKSAKEAQSRAGNTLNEVKKAGWFKRSQKNIKSR